MHRYSVNESQVGQLPANTTDRRDFTPVALNRSASPPISRYGASSCPPGCRGSSSRRPSLNKKAHRSHGGHCPSWARTRTLLIQSPPAGATFPDNLLGFGHFSSIGARIPAVVCPLISGETTAKLRRGNYSSARGPRGIGAVRLCF